MTDIQEANKRRLSNEEDSERESSSKRPRYSPNQERSRSSSHSKRHKSRREGDEERRSRKRHRHRREEKTESSSSIERTSKRRSSSRERTRRKYRRSSHSREKDATNNFNTFNGRSNSFRERSPRENYFARRYYSPPARYSPLARYRDRSRSPRKNRYERDREYDELYEKDDYSAASRNSRGYPALKREIQDLLRIEHHHLAYEGEEDSNGDIQDVEWCYQYLDPTIRGHITGGRAILHHRCRQCNRICLHLLGTYGTGKRMCLGCAARERGWREDEVPLWYFHKPGACQHCRSRQGYHNNY